MKIYQVLHYYDVDGGFGDAVGRTDVVACFENENDAKAFCEKYSNIHVYAEPYSSLYCGELKIKTMELTLHSEFNIENKPSDYGYSTYWFSVDGWENVNEEDDDDWYDDNDETEILDESVEVNDISKCSEIESEPKIDFITMSEGCSWTSCHSFHIID